MGSFDEPGFGGGDWFFSLFPILFGAVFALILGMIIFAIFKNIRQWSYNNKQPQLSVAAEAVTKRPAVRGGGNDTSARTDYFVTFEVDSGDRMEFEVRPQEYGQLVEGDRGILSFQGTRFLGFNRIKKTESI
jgi:hypothetical protein